jgi:hypothetical protein
MRGLPLVPCRWPNCSAAHYGGDWQMLFRARAALPSELVRAADRCHELTLRASHGAVRLNTATLSGCPTAGSPSLTRGGASSSSSSSASSSGGGGASAPSSSGASSANSSSGGGAAPATASAAAAALVRPGAPGSPSKANVYGVSSVPYCNVAGMMLEQAMQAAFTIGLALASRAGAAPARFGAGGGACASCGAPGGVVAAELARFKADIAWWLGHRPEVVVRFARRAADALREYDVWGGGYSAWPDVPWRRSALQFVLDLGLGPRDGVCVSVLDRLQR